MIGRYRSIVRTSKLSSNTIELHDNDRSSLYIHGDISPALMPPYAYTYTTLVPTRIHTWTRAGRGIWSVRYMRGEADLPKITDGRYTLSTRVPDHTSQVQYSRGNYRWKKHCGLSTLKSLVQDFTKSHQR